MDAGVKWDHEEVDYSLLPEMVHDLLAQNRDVIFDVTAISKVYLGDLVALSLTTRLARLATFNQLRPPNFKEPWTMLVHDLVPGEEYEYRNLLGTPIFTQCAADVLPRGLAIRVFVGLTVALMVATVVVYSLFDQQHWAVQLLFIAGACASLVSLFITFFQGRRS